MKRVIWLILIAGVLTAAASSRAQINSYDSSESTIWSDPTVWSLGVGPSISQSGIFITNTTSKAITLGLPTVVVSPGTLTISNLTLYGFTGSTNTLYLANIGGNALHIVNNLNLGFNPNSVAGGSALMSTNSTLIVDGVSGGELEDDGTLIIAGGVLITTNCALVVADGTQSPHQGLLIISNAAVQARDIVVATVSNSTGTIEMSGSAVTLSGALSLGKEFGGNGFVSLNGGSLTVTNGDTTIGLDTVAGGSLLVEAGTFSARSILVGHIFESGGNLTVKGGTVLVSSNLTVGVGTESTGSVNVEGGDLIATNGLVSVGSAAGDFVLIDVSSGLLAARQIDVCIGLNLGQSGTLSTEGGSITASTGIKVGDCGLDQFGHLIVNGGQVIVTNAAHTGFIDLQDGELVLSNGTVQVDRLIMTNTCSHIYHTGGTLIVGSVMLDPNPLRITSIQREGNNMFITWVEGPGQTNALQISTGGAHGSYATNDFVDVFVLTGATTPGLTANYLDIGGATNIPARYYRARYSP